MRDETRNCEATKIRADGVGGSGSINFLDQHCTPVQISIREICGTQYGKGLIT